MFIKFTLRNFVKFKITLKRVCCLEQFNLNGFNKWFLIIFWFLGIFFTDYALLHPIMFCSKTSTLVLCILFSCLPKHYTSFVTAHHPILKLFVHKAPDINLINKYGLIHTIQDYIHWSILDEHMYPTFSVKLSWLVHERTLIKVYLQGRVKAKRICCNNLIPHLLRLAKSEMILQQLEDLILKHPYKVVRGNSNNKSFCKM